MTNLAPYMKALVGAAIAGLASLQQALDGDNAVSSQEWISVVVAFFVALGAVFYIPYKTTVKPPPDEGGAADAGFLFYVLGAVFFLVATLNLLGVGTRGLFG